MARTGLSAIWLIVLLAVLSISHPASSKSRRDKATQGFETLWSARLQSYRTEFAQASMRHKAAVDAFEQKAFSLDPADGRLPELIDSATDDATIGGRGEELEAFLAYTKTKPSLGLTKAYLQGRISTLERSGENVERQRAALAALINKPNLTVGQLIQSVEATAMARGDAIGRGRELELLVQNFSAYSSEYALASQHDQESRARWAAALSAFGRSMSRPVYNFHCSAVGPFVNCSGR